MPEYINQQKEINKLNEEIAELKEKQKDVRSRAKEYCDKNGIGYRDYAEGQIDTSIETAIRSGEYIRHNKKLEEFKNELDRINNTLKEKTEKHDSLNSYPKKTMNAVQMQRMRGTQIEKTIEKPLVKGNIILSFLKGFKEFFKNLFSRKNDKSPNIVEQRQNNFKRP